MPPSAAQWRRSIGGRPMPDRALDQLQRLLRVLPLLADGKAHSYDAISRRSGVPLRTVIADLRVAAERYEGPGGFTESLQIYLGPDRASLSTGAFRRPMRLTGRELAALELGLALLRGETPVEERPIIERARTRLRQAILKLPAGDGLAPVAPDPGPEVDPRLLSDLRRAVEEQMVIQIEYQGSGRKKVEARTVCPYALLPNAGVWYLVAHCKEVSGLRVFRLDRITGHRVTQGKFTVPRGFSLDTVLRDGRVFVARETVTLRVRYSPRIARWISERSTGTFESDGSFIVEHPMADVEWGIRHVLQYGAEAEVLAPEEVRREMGRRVGAEGA